MLSCYATLDCLECHQHHEPICAVLRCITMEDIPNAIPGNILTHPTRRATTTERVENTKTGPIQVRREGQPKSPRQDLDEKFWIGKKRKNKRRRESGGVYDHKASIEASNNSRMVNWQIERLDFIVTGIVPPTLALTHNYKWLRSGYFLFLRRCSGRGAAANLVIVSLPRCIRCATV
jgi:hypothetical protein